MANQKQTFTLSGQLDISQMINSVNKLKNALQKNLNQQDFSKINKEFEKLSLAETEYRNAMKKTFSNQSDVNGAKQAIENYAKAIQKVSTMAETFSRTKHFNIDTGIAKALSDESNRINKETTRISKELENWSIKLENTISNSNLSKEAKKALSKSTNSKDAFSQQVSELKNNATNEYNNKKQSLQSRIQAGEANKTSIKNLNAQQRAERYLTQAELTRYNKAQSSQAEKTSGKVSTMQQQQSQQLRARELQRQLTQAMKIEQDLRNAEKRLKSSQEALTKYKETHSYKKTDREYLNRVNARDNAQQNLAAVQQKTSRKLNSQNLKSSDEIRKEINDTSKVIENLRKQIQKLEEEEKKAQDIISNYNSTTKTAANKEISSIDASAVTLQEQISQNEQERQRAINELSSIENSFNEGQPLLEQQQNNQDDLERLQERTRVAQQQADQNQEVANSINEMNSATRTQTQLDEDRVNLVAQQIEGNERLNSTFDNIANSIKGIISFTTALNAVRTAIRKTFEDIRSLDKSFAEIAMVTEYSVADMWKSYDNYAEMANRLGQTTQSVIQASGLFYQQGLNTAESLELTEDTMKLATLAGLDFKEATSQMTAALRGFHMEMDEGSKVTDVYSELAAKAAADVKGIATAMSKTASIGA